MQNLTVIPVGQQRLAPFIIPAVAAVVPLLSGLFGGKDDREAQEALEQQQLAAAREAAARRELYTNLALGATALVALTLIILMAR